MRLGELKHWISEIDSAYSPETIALARAKAWRAAFEWRNQYRGVNRDCDCRRCKLECAEFDDGMNLIREKLR